MNSRLNSNWSASGSEVASGEVASGSEVASGEVASGVGLNGCVAALSKQNENEIRRVFVDEHVLGGSVLFLVAVLILQ